MEEYGKKTSTNRGLRLAQTFPEGSGTQTIRSVLTSYSDFDSSLEASSTKIVSAIVSQMKKLMKKG
jgi:hypothetical protein